MNKNSTIYVSGHTGLVGSAIIRKLREKGYQYVATERTWLWQVEKQPHLFPEEEVRNLDLREKDNAEYVMRNVRPDYVFHCAAKVGGVLANSTQNAQFFYDNLMISTNVIHAAYKYEVKKLLNLGSVCMYPKEAPNPIKEESLCNGEFEPTNEGYAVAKVAAAKMCQMYNKTYETNFYTLVPCNLYGPNDNFDPTSSHVLPALIRKFHKAKINNWKAVSLWGDGSARREFLHVDDLAECAVLLMETPMLRDYAWDHGMRCIYNCSGEDSTSIYELAHKIKRIIGYEGEITWDTNYPNGASLRSLADDRLQSILTWRPNISLEEGIRTTYHWALQNDAFDS